MKYLAIVLVLFCGCHSDKAPQWDVTAEPHVRIIPWDDLYVKAANEYISETHECVSEMYSRAGDSIHPVYGGPICKDSCDLLDKVNALVDVSPVVGAENYRINGSELCRDVKRYHAKEGK